MRRSQSTASHLEHARRIITTRIRATARTIDVHFVVFFVVFSRLPERATTCDLNMQKLCILRIDIGVLRGLVSTYDDIDILRVTGIDL